MIRLLHEDLFMVNVPSMTEAQLSKTGATVLRKFAGIACLDARISKRVLIESFNAVVIFCGAEIFPRVTVNTPYHLLHWLLIFKFP